MITIKTAEEIETLKKGGKLLAGVLCEVKKVVKPGVRTNDLDVLAEKLIRESGGTPSFKGYNPYGAKMSYPSTLCVSINDEVVHAIPKKERILQDGDLVSLDIGMLWPAEANAKAAGGRGMYTDMAITIPVGEISKEDQKLMRVTEESLMRGIKKIKAGARTGDIGAVIQEYVENHGYSVVRDLAGHGVGYAVHEDPFVPNFGKAGTGIVLKEGMVLAIEPMATWGTGKVVLDEDEWTFRTADGKHAAHFEHTVVVTRDGNLIVTK